VVKNNYKNLVSGLTTQNKGLIYFWRLDSVQWTVYN